MIATQTIAVAGRGDYLNIRQAASLLPTGREGRPTHPATLTRWITHGTRSPSGEIVRLRAVRMGGRWLTTAAWLEEYGSKLAPAYAEGGAQ